MVEFKPDEDLVEVFFSEDEPRAETDSLKNLARLVRAAKETAKDVEQAELRLKNTQQKLRQILDVEIPSAMQEAGGITSIEVSGTKVIVKPFYSARITEDTRAGALDWLRAEGHEGLIKHEFTANLGRGPEAATAREMLEQSCQEDGLAYKVSETVHPQTLSAFVREQTEKGTPVPSDLFNIYIGVTTKLTDAK